MEFVTLYYNECSQIPYASVLMARTRLAQQIEGLRTKEYFDCNPPERTLHLQALERRPRPGNRQPIDTLPLWTQTGQQMVIGSRAGELRQGARAGAGHDSSGQRGPA